MIKYEKYIVLFGKARIASREMDLPMDDNREPDTDLEETGNQEHEIAQQDEAKEAPPTGWRAVVGRILAVVAFLILAALVVWGTDWITALFKK